MSVVLVLCCSYLYASGTVNISGVKADIKSVYIWLEGSVNFSELIRNRFEMHFRKLRYVGEP